MPPKTTIPSTCRTSQEEDQDTTLSTISLKVSLRQSMYQFSPTTSSRQWSRVHQSITNTHLKDKLLCDLEASSISHFNHLKHSSIRFNMPIWLIKETWLAWQWVALPLRTSICLIRPIMLRYWTGRTDRWAASPTQATSVCQSTLLLASQSQVHPMSQCRIQDLQTKRRWTEMQQGTQVATGISIST